MSTPDTWRLRGLMGIFYGDLDIWDDTAWSYKTEPNCAPGGPTSGCLLTVQSWPGAPAYIYGDRPSVGFFDDFKRVVKQRAAYVSSSFDIIPNTLTISGGIRYFDMYDSETGGDVGSFYCKIFSASQLADVPIVDGNYGALRVSTGSLTDRLRLMAPISTTRFTRWCRPAISAAAI